MAAEAEQRLRESPYFALRTLRCDYHEGVLTVRGRVPSFYFRQMAVETLRRLKSVEQLVDRIEVD
jgi:osmotically-inducible protein OsmY